jgi:hypothetical protein
MSRVHPQVEAGYWGAGDVCFLNYVKALRAAVFQISRDCAKFCTGFTNHYLVRQGQPAIRIATGVGTCNHGALSKSASAGKNVEDWPNLNPPAARHY